MADGNAIMGVMTHVWKLTSQSSINTVVKKWWLPFVLLHALAYTTIPAGSIYRGGVMASFTLHLARSDLKVGTIQGYVWGFGLFANTTFRLAELLQIT